jgi:hypothetical protein
LLSIGQTLNALVISPSQTENDFIAHNGTR